MLAAGEHQLYNETKNPQSWPNGAIMLIKFQKTQLADQWREREFCCS